MNMNNGTSGSTKELIRIRGGMCKTKPVNHSSGRCGNMRILLHHRGNILRLMRRIVIHPFFISCPYPSTLLSVFFLIAALVALLATLRLFVPSAEVFEILHNDQSKFPWRSRFNPEPLFNSDCLLFRSTMFVDIRGMLLPERIGSKCGV